MSESRAADCSHSLSYQTPTDAQLQSASVLLGCERDGGVLESSPSPLARASYTAVYIPRLRRKREAFCKASNDQGIRSWLDYQSNWEPARHVATRTLSRGVRGRDLISSIGDPVN